MLNGDVSWVGGASFGGTGTVVIAPNRVVTITGAGAHIGESVTLENHGTINLLSSRLFIYAPAAFTNKTDGIVNLDGNGAGFGAASGAQVKNEGTLNKTGGGNSSFANGGASPLNNTGTVNVQNGTLILDAGGTSTGTFNVSAGQSLQFAGAYTLGNGTQINGPGSTQLSSGIQTVPASATASINGPLTLSGGLACNGTLMLNGSVSWLGLGGSFGGTGTVIISHNSVATITGSGAHIGDSVTLENHGTINLQSTAFFIYAPATFTNKTDGIVNLDGAGGFWRRQRQRHKSRMKEP